MGREEKGGGYLAVKVQYVFTYFLHIHSYMNINTLPYAHTYMFMFLYYVYVHIQRQTDGWMDKANCRGCFVAKKASNDDVCRCTIIESTRENYINNNILFFLYNWMMNNFAYCCWEHRDKLIICLCMYCTIINCDSQPGYGQQ